MPVTLRSLTADPRFGLRLVVAGADRVAWESPIAWAHSSDLPDPTPWLEPGQLLLTNGAQFGTTPAPSHRQADDYAQRLVARGLLALGFATRIVHDEIPANVAAACERAGLPLLEVPGHVPFIAIVRHVADEIAAERHRRLEWSLSAQRALGRAASRADGLAAVLHELERHLDCWVALFDAAGNRIPVRMIRDIPAALTGEVQEAVGDVLRRGLRAGTRLPAGHGAITLQALGQRDEVRGVLAVGTALPPGHAESDLILSVIALASISLEQSRLVEAAGRSLRTGVLELLHAGTVTAAHALADRVGGALPEAPLQIAVLPLETVTEPVRYELEREARDGAPWFVAERDERLVVVTAVGNTARLVAVLERHRLPSGVSGAGDWTDFARLAAEAENALARARGGGRPVRFDELLGDGLVGALAAHGGAELARGLLAGLTASSDRAALIATARVWLDQGCAWDPAARTLGVHRHTVRNRITAVEQATGLDLDTPRGRTELWLALELLDVRI
ncbi:MAG: PucR family transcriptional regulator [Micropruina sp.]|uniref:PucR family transcriptional regulator n=1 Tax=Micropruina sp. TaxID=2737536 RepID=UPI0039E64146